MYFNSAVSSEPALPPAVPGGRAPGLRPLQLEQDPESPGTGQWSDWHYKVSGELQSSLYLFFLFYSIGWRISSRATNSVQYMDDGLQGGVGAGSNKLSGWINIIIK